jgi:hypothetical protein
VVLEDDMLEAGGADGDEQPRQRTHGQGPDAAAAEETGACAPLRRAGGS